MTCAKLCVPWQIYEKNFTDPFGREKNKTFRKCNSVTERGFCVRIK